MLGRGESICLLVVAEDVFVVFEKTLDSVPLEGYIGQFALNVHRAHDCWSEDDGEIQWGHLKECKHNIDSQNVISLRGYR